MLSSLESQQILVSVRMIEVIPVQFKAIAALKVASRS
jgi:hypothetical protein